ncbi:MAG: c-type cytochrome [Chloroflexi bacterium]|nr:c-type cytochrome [Chloroflexota bacterium]
MARDGNGRLARRLGVWRVVAPALAALLSLGLGLLPVLAQGTAATGATGTAPTAAQGAASPSWTAAPPVPTPASPPDAEAGLATYRERCSSCHGSFGRGDGEMRDQLPAAPASFADPTYARAARPATAFDVVTHGRLDKLMPPWGEALEPQARWDVIFGAWSFYATPERLVRGRDAWTASCAACHGERAGAADAEHLLPLADPAWWLERSLDEVYAGLRGDSGAGDAHATLAALPENALRASLDYARSAMYRPLPFEALSLDGSIAGRVVNGSTGSDSVEGARVLLVPVGRVGGEILPSSPVSTTVGADGTFRFDQLLAGPELAYRLVASYAGADYFGAELVDAVPGGDAAVPAEVQVYDADPDAPVDARLAQIVVAAQPESGFISMAEAWVIRNAGDRSRSGDPVLRFTLPEGAEGLGFDDPRLQATQRFEDGQALTQVPVPPGETNLLFSYGLPYPEDGFELTRILDLAVDELHVIVIGENLRVESAALPERLEEDRGGERITDISGRQLAAGSEVRVRIDGLPEPSAEAQAAMTRPLAPLPYDPALLAGICLALATLGGLALAAQPLWRRDPSSIRLARALSAERSAVVARIAALDRSLRDGEIAPDEHRRRRAALIERAIGLARAMRNLEPRS